MQPSLSKSVLLLLLPAIGGCSSFGGKRIMPARDETASYFSAKVERKRLPTFHFSEDMAVISVDEQPNLKRLIDHLTAHPTDRLLLAGFAPDDGTEEYNRVLGEQRSQSIRAALIDRGADPDRIQTVSYGKLYAGDNDNSSRRVEVGIIRAE